MAGTGGAEDMSPAELVKELDRRLWRIKDDAENVSKIPRSSCIDTYAMTRSIYAKASEALLISKKLEQALASDAACDGAPECGEAKPAEGVSVTEWRALDRSVNVRMVSGKVHCLRPEALAGLLKLVRGHESDGRGTFVTGDGETVILSGRNIESVEYYSVRNAKEGSA